VSLPSLVTIGEFETRYGASIDDAGRAQALLDDASALVREVAGFDYVNALTGELDGVPTGLVGVVCDVTRRAYDNPAGLESETIGDYTWRAGTFRGAGAYLTDDERRRVKRAAGKMSVTSVSLTKYMPYTAVGDTASDESDF